jgi:hypothetical protein
MNLGHPRFANPEQPQHAAYDRSDKTSTRRAPTINRMPAGQQHLARPASPRRPRLTSHSGFPKPEQRSRAVPPNVSDQPERPQCYSSSTYHLHTRANEVCV